MLTAHPSIVTNVCVCPSCLHHNCVMFPFVLFWEMYFHDWSNWFFSAACLHNIWFKNILHLLILTFNSEDLCDGNKDKDEPNPSSSCQSHVHRLKGDLPCIGLAQLSFTAKYHTADCISLDTKCIKLCADYISPSSSANPPISSWGLAVFHLSCWFHVHTFHNRGECNHWNQLLWWLGGMETCPPLGFSSEQLYCNEQTVSANWCLCCPVNWYGNGVTQVCLYANLITKPLFIAVYDASCFFEFCFLTLPSYFSPSVE